MSQTNLSRARYYIALFNDPQASRAALAEFLAPGIVYIEMPNRLSPAGSTSNREQMLSGLAQGQEILSEQRYTIVNAIDGGATVVLEVAWTGTLRRGFGELAAGTTLRAQIAMVLEFVDGQIVSQRNYDAYDPF
jgi:ketosteroid isomerase-like protein